MCIRDSAVLDLPDYGLPVRTQVIEPRPASARIRADQRGRPPAVVTALSASHLVRKTAEDLEALSCDAGEEAVDAVGAANRA